MRVILLSNQQYLVEPIIDRSLFDDQFRNEYGSIRNNKVRSHYYGLLISLEDVVELFQEWRDDAEYFILRGAIPYDVPYIDISEVHNFTEHFYKFVKASKRGNDVYQYLVNKKLKPLQDIDNVTFFKDDWGVKCTNLLFITLTYDTSLCDVNTAWSNIGNDFHLFHNNLKKQYGHKVCCNCTFEYKRTISKCPNCKSKSCSYEGVELFRTWESTKGYYPHVHAIIGFKDTSFQVIPKTNRQGKKKFRITNHHKNKISSYWHSHVDIQGVGDTEGAIDELTKYITKDLCSDKGNKTNAMIWLFRKQAYSVSKGFVGLITNQFVDIDLSEPKIDDLLEEQMCNCNQDVIKWEFVGILRGKQLGFSPSIWCVDIKKPPPKLVEMLIHEYYRWRDAHGCR